MPTDRFELKNDFASPDTIPDAWLNRVADAADLLAMLCELAGSGILAAGDGNAGRIAEQLACTVTAVRAILGEAGYHRPVYIPAQTYTGLPPDQAVVYLYAKRDGTLTHNTTGAVPAHGHLLATFQTSETEIVSGTINNAPAGRVNFEEVLMKGRSATVTGNLTVTGDYVGPARITGTPPASTTTPLFRVGNTELSGGNANGTYVGLNAHSGFQGDLFNFQVNRKTMFKMTYNGLVHFDRPANFTNPGHTIGLDGGLYLTPTPLDSSNNHQMLLTFPSTGVFRIGAKYDGNIGGAVWPKVQVGRYNAPYLTVDTSTGRVGVGTDAPSQTLHVVGAALFDGNLGFFNATPVAKTAVADPSAVVTTETAETSYTSNEQTMLNNLKTDVQNLCSKLQELVDALQALGLV